MDTTNNIKNKKSKVAIKILLISLAVTLASILVFNFFALFVFNGLGGHLQFYLVFIACTLSIIVWIVIFTILMYRYVLKRVSQLNEAVEKVAKGDYTVEVPIKGNDEISTLAENFNKMTKELQANVMLSKNFVSYVSHEFKTPLSVIRSYAEGLQVGNSDEQEYLNIIINETATLTELAKNIILLCRLDSTTITSKNDVFSPASQIRAFILSTQLKWGEKNIDVVPELEDFEISGNEALTYLVWQNLIGNAIKFTENNGCIDIALTKQEDTLCFEVKDDGVGIDDEDKDKIFMLFYTGDKSRNIEGSGIGLYLTKTIVEKLGGNISFTSERGKGSMFKVILPL